MRFTNPADRLPGQFFYRVKDQAYSAGADEWGDPIPGGPTRTNLDVFPVLRRTPKGVVIDDCGEERFIADAWGKRYACATVEEAKASFVARKKRQIRICRARIKDAEEALRYLEKVGFYTDARKWNGIEVEE